MLLAVLLIMAVAEGHHVRGLPHYKYGDGYPGTPDFENMDTVGDYEIRLTFFKIPNMNVRDVAVYVRHTGKDKAYTDTVMVSIYAEGEGPDKAHQQAAWLNKNNIHKISWREVEDDIYCIRVMLQDDGKEIETTFRVQIGKAKLNYWFLGGVAVVVLLLITTVAIINKKRARN